MTTLVDVTQALVDKIEDHRVALGVEAVFYGDQNRVAVTPTIAVDPGSKSRVLNGAPRRTMTTFEVFVMIYHARVQDTQVTRKEADALAEAIEDLIHQDRTLGGGLIHCMVDKVESGYSFRSGTMYRSSRLTFGGDALQMLPYP